MYLLPLMKYVPFDFIEYDRNIEYPVVGYTGCWISTPKSVFGPPGLFVVNYVVVDLLLSFVPSSLYISSCIVPEKDQTPSIGGSP